MEFEEQPYEDFKEARKMLKELIRDKINEIFLEVQNSKGVTDGGIDPSDALQLNQIEELLAELIEKVTNYQPKAINFEEFNPSWYIYTDYEGNLHSKTFDGDVEANQFFHDVSYRIAFDDCSGETVQKIYYKGKEVEYMGWKPGMKYEYADLDGNTIWVGVFEHWDH